jgi:hypothetical protein
LARWARCFPAPGEHWPKSLEQPVSFFSLRIASSQSQHALACLKLSSIEQSRRGELLYHKILLGRDINESAWESTKLYYRFLFWP